MKKVILGFRKENGVGTTRKMTKALLFGVLLFLFTFTPVCPTLAQQGWKKEWNATIAAAKKEGKVTVRGFRGSRIWQGPTTKFTKRFGIPVEYLTGRGSQVAARMRAERRAKVYAVDAFLAGIGTLSRMLQEKMLDPLKPALILPEVVDGSKWKKGKLWFMDPEGKYILRLVNYVSGLIYINTDHVKPEEIQSVKDLLNPKWRGKITCDDPTVSGSGSVVAAHFYLKFGEEFVKKLYVGQKPAISRNSRQRADWLVRGAYPVAFNISGRAAIRLEKEGFPIRTIHSLRDAPGVTGAGSGLIGLVNKAPHPNAARLFVNWLASKEGLEEYSRVQLLATTRTDVDESFLPQEAVPRPGLDYFDSYSWDFSVTQRRKIQLRIKELLRRK